MAEAAAAAAPRIAETLAEGSAERREAAYAEVETAARSALSLSGAARDEPAALAFGSVRPIIEAAVGAVECGGARFFLKETKAGVHRFTVHSAERELKLRAPAATYSEWLDALRPVMGDIEMP